METTLFTDQRTSDLLSEYRDIANAWLDRGSKDRAWAYQTVCGYLSRLEQVGPERIEPATWSRHNGRCPVKGCKHRSSILLPTVVLPMPMPIRKCPEHDKMYSWKRVIGRVVDSIKCDARCMNASGQNCDCQCGGLNHGANHG